jgi:hypothetical protein
VTRYAPILQAIAGRIAGLDAGLLRTDPVRWAYALREAVELARPDVVVSHLDDRLEVDTVLAAAPAEGDLAGRLLDVPALAELAPAGAAVELVRTLAGIYRSGPGVAATLTGPVTLAGRIGSAMLPAGAAIDDPVELAEIAGDLLAGLAAAYADAGATVLVVFESDRSAVVREADRQAALRPIARIAEHKRVELVVCGAPSSGDLVAGERGLLLSLVPADVPLERLQRA